MPYFAHKVQLGRGGVESVEGLGSLSDAERKGLEVGWQSFCSVYRQSLLPHQILTRCEDRDV